MGLPSGSKKQNLNSYDQYAGGQNPGYKPNFDRKHMRFRTDRELNNPELHKLEYFANIVHLSKRERHKPPIKFYPKFWPYAERSYPQWLRFNNMI